MLPISPNLDEKPYSNACVGNDEIGGGLAASRVDKWDCCSGDRASNVR